MIISFSLTAIHMNASLVTKITMLQHYLSSVTQGNFCILFDQYKPNTPEINKLEECDS